MKILLALLILILISALVVYAFNKLATYCKKQVSGLRPIPARCYVCHIGIAKKTNNAGHYICENCN